jgi:CubicO group peptidase (beta-lactamase class C family)
LHLSELPFTSEFDTTAIHCNMMFDLAALVVEKLDGRKFEVGLKEDIFDPLEMSQTSFVGQAGEDVAMGLCPCFVEGELRRGEGIEVGTGPNQGVQSLKSGILGKGSFGIISTPLDIVSSLRKSLL